MKYIVFDCDGTLVDTSTPKYSLFPGIKELLVEFAQSYQLYVWTARDRLSTLRILQENGIYQYFEDISTISDAPAKPNIMGLVRILGDAPRDAICMIGDSSSDMIGGKSFGILCIGAVWNQDASGAFLKESGADFIVSHPSECSKLVEQNLKGAKHA